MKRTRKWKYVEQEAIRLAGVGLSITEIAKRLGVDGSTVRRWRQAGKIDVRRQRVMTGDPVTGQSEEDGQELSPEEWGAWVRSTFALDATDAQMVLNAQMALRMAQDARRPDTVRLAAMNQYRAIVRQLALVARAGEASKAEPEPGKRHLRVVPKRRAEPRVELVAVNE